MAGSNGEIIKYEFDNHTIYFYPTPMAPALIKEIFSDNYHVLQSKIEFNPGDVILDLGANEGMFSIMMAKLFPQTRIISLEPVPRTYHQLMRNIGLNGITNIEAHMVGVGKVPGRRDIYMGKNDYSGGSSSYLTHNPSLQDIVSVEIVTLDDVWDYHGLDKVRLIKCDIEGAEYDALYPFTHWDKVDYFVGEIHRNGRLDFQSRRPEALAVWLNDRTKVIHIDAIRMAE